jgi:hypothetical protein
MNGQSDEIFSSVSVSGKEIADKKQRGKWISGKSPLSFKNYRDYFVEWKTSHKIIHFLAWLIRNSITVYFFIQNKHNLPPPQYFHDFPVCFQ